MRRLYAFVSFVLILMLAGGITYALNGTMQRLPIRQYFTRDVPSAVWDWNSPESYTDATLKQKAQALYVNGIDTVYVDISSYTDARLDDASDADAVKVHKTEMAGKLETYIRAMHKKRISVYGAAGNTDWSKPQNQYLPLSLLHFVRDYNDTHAVKLAGIQYDIESYNQEGFAEASFTEKGLVLGEFVDTVHAVVEQNRNSGDDFEIGFAVPYWFDNSNGNIRSISWGDKTGPALYHVIDQLAGLPKADIVVMAYRDAAVGNDGILYLSRTEIEYAQSRASNVRVIIGAEAGDVEPEKITFFDQSKVELANEFKIVHDEFIKSGVYGGVAINDADSFLALRD